MELPYLAPALEEFLHEEMHHLPIVAPNLNPNPNHNPSPSPSPTPDPNLRPVISTAFKREARKKRRERKRQRKLEEKLEGELHSLLAIGTHPHQPVPSPASNIEWPCNDTALDPDPEPAGWAVPDPNPLPPPPPPSGEEQGRAAPMQVQQNALTQCQEFFAANDGSDDEQADDDDEESENLKFFVGLFEKDGDLRGVYERDWEKGEFCCLVCGAIGEKLGKRYGNCVGLVQHANTVSKTKKREAHRDFGRAVCRVLGWDIDKLPGIFDGQPFATDAESQEQIGILDEVWLHKGVAGDAGSGKGELVDFMEADTDTD